MEPLLNAAATAPVKDVTTATFMADVIEASREAAIVVDFWAPWCGPCKQLAPALEKAVKDTRGKVRLVKINIDQNPDLAQQMRIQSIPAVYAFRNGRPVDGFVGALPESQVKSFVQRLAQAAGASAGPSPIDEAMEAAKEALEAGDVGNASALFGQILQHEPGHAGAVAGLARCHLQSGDAKQATQVLATVAADKANDPEILAVKAQLEVASQAAATGDVADLMEKVAHNHNDHQARFDLALALFARGKQEAAVDELLEIFRRDRKWNDEAARKQLLKFFEALGPTNELTVSARRRLSSLMFS
ncbi:MAG: thioredoxin [Alphaproteobacteria bacterium]|nr:thioredoxin [Alphaproteobacteria bacterium]